MKLTKEECIKALNVLKEQHDYLSFMLHSNYPYSIEIIKIVQSCFEQLINEHFDNPPLKFDELRPSIWVWDNLNKEYIQIEWLDIEGESYKYLMAHTVPSNEYQRLYSNNRFYRREVQK